MTTYTQLATEAPALVARCIALGIGKIKPPPPAPPGHQPMSEDQRARNRKRSLNRFYKQRAEWVSQGLTTQGRVRQRGPYVSHKTLTPEQLVERKRKQKMESYERCRLRRVD